MPAVSEVTALADETTRRLAALSRAAAEAKAALGGVEGGGIRGGGLSSASGSGGGLVEAGSAAPRARVRGRTLTAAGGGLSGGDVSGRINKSAETAASAQSISAALERGDYGSAALSGLPLLRTNKAFVSSMGGLASTGASTTIGVVRGLEAGEMLEHGQYLGALAQLGQAAGAAAEFATYIGMLRGLAPKLIGQLATKGGLYGLAAAAITAGVYWTWRSVVSMEMYTSDELFETRKEAHDDFLQTIEKSTALARMGNLRDAAKLDADMSGRIGHRLAEKALYPVGSPAERFFRWEQARQENVLWLATQRARGGPRVGD